MLLRRRHDTVPNLVAAVSGYAGHEQALRYEAWRKPELLRLTAQRPGSPRRCAESALGGDVKTVLAVAEAYPELKASASFVDLQRQLAATEDGLEQRASSTTIQSSATTTRPKRFPAVSWPRCSPFARGNSSRPRRPNVRTCRRGNDRLRRRGCGQPCVQRRVLFVGRSSRDCSPPAIAASAPCHVRSWPRDSRRRKPLANGGRVTPDAVPATLLDLAARRVVKIEDADGDTYACRLGSQPSGDLTAYESRVLALLRRKPRAALCRRGH